MASISRRLFGKISQYLSDLSRIFFPSDFPPALAILTDPRLGSPVITPDSLSSQHQLLDGFLWAVQRDRRTLEKRLCRKFGSEKYGTKLLKPKTNLRVCNTCSHYYEAGHLCPNCYEKVKKETEEMQEAIQEKLGLQPVEKEVMVLYDEEKDECSDEMLEARYAVELKKERPRWFSQNLMQRTTRSPVSDDTTLKPHGLG